MPNSILIKIVTKIEYADKTKETLINNYEGQIFLKNGEKYIRYQENPEQELGNTWTIIRWNVPQSLNTVTIIRQGDTKLKQVFQGGYSYVSEYRNAHGFYELDSDTKSVSIEEFSSNSGNINLNYVMKINSELIGNYELQISYKDKNSFS